MGERRRPPNSSEDCVSPPRSPERPALLAVSPFAFVAFACDLSDGDRTYPTSDADDTNEGSTAGRSTSSERAVGLDGPVKASTVVEVTGSARPTEQDTSGRSDVVPEGTSDSDRIVWPSRSAEWWAIRGRGQAAYVYSAPASVRPLSQGGKGWTRP